MSLELLKEMLKIRLIKKQRLDAEIEWYEKEIKKLEGLEK